MENTLTLFLGVVGLLGICGLIARTWIALMLTAGQSIDDKSAVRRYVFRLFEFMLFYLVSFIFTPVFVSSLTKSAAFLQMTESSRGVLYLVMCIPLALVLTWLDFKLIRKQSLKKVEARKKLIARK